MALSILTNRNIANANIVTIFFKFFIFLFLSWSKFLKSINENLDTIIGMEIIKGTYIKKETPLSWGIPISIKNKLANVMTNSPSEKYNSGLLFNFNEKLISIKYVATNK